MLDLSNEIFYDILPQGASDLEELKFKTSQKGFFLRKMECLDNQALLVLMHLVIKHHAIPHFQPFTSGIWHGSTFK